MIFRFNIILFFLLFTFNNFSQFSINDRELVNTTFTRMFKSEIISQYLNSSKSEKIIAALLSVSHSKDTSLIQEIIKLDYERYGDYINFALGQIGGNKTSSSFLKNIIEEKSFTTHFTYEAYGKCGDFSDYDFIIKYFDNNPTDEIIYSLYYFYVRNIYDDRIYEILKNILTNSEILQYKEYSAFTIFRTKPDSSFIPIIINELENISDINEDNETFVRYLLSTLRKLQTSSDEILLTKFISSNNWTVQLAAVELIKFQNEIDNVLFSIILNLFDNNNNLLKVFISELPKIKFNKIQKEKIVENLKSLYSETDSQVLKGEIVLSLINFNEKNFAESKIPGLIKEYKYKAKTLLLDKNNLFKELQSDFNIENETGKMFIANTLLQYKDELQNFYFSIIKENSPILISIGADALNESFIKSNIIEIKDLILKTVNQHLHDANYVESLMSLFNLSKKVNNEFSESVRELISNSNVYSNKTYTINNLTETKDTSMFHLFWDNAFKYSGAEIETDKGIINIKFHPEYAPISVGNFVYSILTGVYRNVFFHRVVPSFVIQGGDPTGTGWGGPGYDIISEFSPLNYNKGMVGMASAGKDTEGSQFFIMQAEHPHLNGRYTIFATVISGQEVVELIEQYDKILKITLR